MTPRSLRGRLSKFSTPNFLKPKSTPMKYRLKGHWTEGTEVNKGGYPRVDNPYKTLTEFLFILIETGQKQSKPQIFKPDRQ
jgi:hypothetical protein